MSYFPNFIRSKDNLSGNFIDSNKKFLFHHIPKTAGSTFRGILETFFEEDQICPCETVEELKNLPKNELDKYNLYAGHFSYGIIDKILSNATWVTFLREPNERVISQYFNHSNPDRIPNHWKKRVSENKKWSTYINEATGKSLEEWFFLKNKHLNTISRNRQTQAFLPQQLRVNIDDWSIHNDKLLSIAKENLIQRFSFFGIQEYFNLSLFLFCETFGILHFDNSENFTTNTNQKKGFNNKYDIDKTLSKKITESNSMDWELYKFAKEEFFKRINVFNSYYLKKYKEINLSSKLIEKMSTSEKNENINKLVNISRRERKDRIDYYIRNNETLKKDSDKNKFTITDLFSHSGLHKVEYTRLKKSFSWTGAGKTAFLEINKKLIQGQKYKIKINVINFLDIKVIESLSIKFNDFMVRHEFTRSRLSKYSNTISFEYLVNSESFYNIIEISSELILENPEKNKSRLLGIAIHSITIRRI